jgi:hypothetical protein
MYYCIVILISVALLHFVYESILAPSFRLQLRFELLKLNDEVERLKIESGRGQQPFCELQDSIESLLCLLFRFDLVMVRAISAEIDRDAGLKQRVAARSRILDECVVPEVLAIRRQQFRIAMKALAVNGGPLLVWLALPALLLVGYQAVRGKIQNTLTVPGRDLKRFLPEGGSMGAGLPA